MTFIQVSFKTPEDEIRACEFLPKGVPIICRPVRDLVLSIEQLRKIKEAEIPIYAASNNGKNNFDKKINTDEVIKRYSGWEIESFLQKGLYHTKRVLFLFKTEKFWGEIKLATRPFEQSKYNIEDLKIKELIGYAYKLSLLLPLTEKGKRIFSPADQLNLRTLFREDFGGCTWTQGITHPLLAGEYVDENGISILNEHARFEVYTKQNSLVIRYFQDLEKNILKYSKNVITKRVKDYKGEEKLLMELVTVKLL